MYGATIGKASILGVSAATNQACAVGIPTAVSTNYLYYYLLSQADAFSDAGKGGAQPNISQGIIKAWRLWLPPRAEQTRIVEKLEALLGDLDTAVAELKAAQRKLASLRQSLLKAAVEGTLTEAWRSCPSPCPRSGEGEAGRGLRSSRKSTPPQPSPSPAAKGREQETGADLLQRILRERRARWETKQLAKFAAQGKTPPKGWQAKYPEPVAPDTTDLPQLPEGWVWATIDQLAASVRNGLSQKPEQEPRGYPILRINAVRAMSVNLDEVRYLPISADEAENYLLQNGDLLATRYNGSVDLLGVVGVVRGLTRETLHPDKLIRIQPVLDEHLADWIEVAASTGVSRAHIVSRVKTTAGQTGISGDDLKRMPVPLPPTEEQYAIIEQLDAALTACDTQQAAIAHALQQAAAQRRNLLKTAFAGQLVPQDPADEPASELLARIRAAHVSNAVAGKRRGRKKA